jgi:glycine cleavage system regulatory protein
MGLVVLTVIGDDRPGLVSALAEVIGRHGASWERSQMARLAGTFAGIVQVRVADDRADALVSELRSTEGFLEVVVARSADAPAPTAHRLQLSLVGTDRPGIVREIAAALAAHGVSIDELSTEVRAAPMSGGLLFEATAVLLAPDLADLDAVRATLERLADELMVDLDLGAT